MIHECPAVFLLVNLIKSVLDIKAQVKVSFELLTLVKILIEIQAYFKFMKAAYNAKNRDFCGAINIHVLHCLPNARADFND